MIRTFYTVSFRASGASRSESNKMIAGGNHTLILRTLAWESVSPRLF